MVSGHRFTLDAFLVVAITLVVTVAPLMSPSAAVAAASVTAFLAMVAWLTRHRGAAPLGAFCVVCFGLVLAGVGYSQVVLGSGLVFYAIVVRVTPWLRGSATWMRWGSFGNDVRALSAAAGLIAAVALVSWYVLLDPNLDDLIAAFVPDQPLGVLIVGGLLFSMVNAAVEEGAYRGVILHALDSSLGAGPAALVLQAVAFGALHIRGFPRGWLGVGLACVYGLLMGVIRRRAGGMFAPWIAHVLTDVVVVGIVILLAQPNTTLQAIASSFE